MGQSPNEHEAQGIFNDASCFPSPETETEAGEGEGEVQISANDGAKNFCNVIPM